MATLLPSLSSDEEDNNKSSSHHESDDDDEAPEMDNSFEFGGILGEDGGLNASSITNTRPGAAWSYQTALNNLERQQAGRNAAAVPRMDTGALIAAKRKALEGEKAASKKSKKNKQQQQRVSSDDDNDHDDNDDNSSQRSGSDDSDDGSSSSDDSDSDDSQNEGKPVMDDSHKNLQEDVLKTRAGAVEKKKKKKHDNPQEENSEGEEGNSSDSDEDDNDKKEAAKAEAFFDSEPNGTAANNAGASSAPIEVFAQLTLSRPLLRGVAAMGFVQPTPVQAAVIPLALQGRDICASAVTGSGKTAAFVLPVLERLLHRHAGRTKALVLTPTRELAAQCLGMLTALAQYTQLTASLVVGGSKNSKAQAAELRARPDIVIATPGRLLDHVTNTPGVTLEDIEFLVLDEADRLLDLGFQDEIMELVKECPAARRQTMLFSATMNTKVDDLIQLSLKNPVRVRISSDNNNSISQKKSGRDMEMAPRLEQEFVRVQSGNEGLNREGMLLALLTRTFTKQVIVFFDTKAAAHRLMILCGLCGIQCAELHGNLTQQQRLTALEDFRQGNVDVLLATDLAARGLDIDLVQTVLNFEMPSQIDTYVHRVGRAARAGRSGRSCTLIGEGRRHLMKEIIKNVESSNNKRNKNKSATTKAVVAAEKGVIRSRSIPAAVIAHFAAKIQTLEPHLEEVLQAEAVARMDRIAEMEAIKAQNIIEHADEIQARPQREWFASSKQKAMTKAAAAERKKEIEEKAGTGTHRMTRKKRRAREAMEAMRDAGSDDEGADDSATRKASKINIKSEARKQKRQEEAKRQEAFGKSVYDFGKEEERKAQKKKSKSMKSASGDAAGDSNLFSEEVVTHARKGSKKRGGDESADGAAPKSAFHFRGYDPDKKLGKKKAHKSFKSKAKYKRRK